MVQCRHPVIKQTTSLTTELHRTQKHNNIRSFLFKIYFEISAGNFVQNKPVHCQEVITVRFTLITLNS